MTRFPRFAALLAALAFMMVGGVALAQYAQGANQPAKPVQPQIPSLPGFWQLRMPSVQKDLELVPEQIEKLKQIGKKYYEDMRAQRTDYKDWNKLTPEERSAKYKEMMEKRKEQAEAVRKQIEKVLLPHQLKALEDINFRAVAPSMLYQPKVIEKVGITDEQKAKIRKIQQDMREKYQELQKQSVEEMLKVLSPEQKKKLKEQIQSRSRGYYYR